MLAGSLLGPQHRKQQRHKLRVLVQMERKLRGVRLLLVPSGQAQGLEWLRLAGGGTNSCHLQRRQRQKQRHPQMLQVNQRKQEQQQQRRQRRPHRQSGKHHRECSLAAHRLMAAEPHAAPVHSDAKLFPCFVLTCVCIPCHERRLTLIYTRALPCRRIS